MKERNGKRPSEKNKKKIGIKIVLSKGLSLSLDEWRTYLELCRTYRDKMMMVEPDRIKAVVLFLVADGPTFKNCSRHLMAVPRDVDTCEFVDDDEREQNEKEADLIIHYLPQNFDEMWNLTGQVIFDDLVDHGPTMSWNGPIGENKKRKKVIGWARKQRLDHIFELEQLSE